MLLKFIPSANAQTSNNTPSPEINTDRPTATPSAFVVPPNYIQTENGLGLTKEHAGQSLNAPHTLVRLGILPRAELRLTVPNYFLVRGGPNDLSGVADMSVGAKIQLGPLPGKLQLAVILGITVPTGSRVLSTNAVDPFVQIIAGRALSKNWTICSAQSIFLKTEVSEPQNDGEIPTSNQGVIYQPTCVLFRKLGPKADFFTEYVGNFQRSTLSNQIMDCGGLYRFRRNQQLGVRFGVGLTKASPTAFVEFGYSVLLGKLLR